tara:strand:- start:803 stop:1225 length:423 start_codon:yes stop_codon:yes gene_type:complete
MATRAIIRIAEREDGVSFSEHPEKVRAQIYHHYDGYPEYLGCNLAEFLCDFRVVNGLPTNYFENIKVANGMGCLTAQLIAGLKEEAGNVYVDYPDTDRDDVEFTYYIWGCVGKDIWMSIFDLHDNCIFVGKPQTLIEKYQ